MCYKLMPLGFGPGLVLGFRLPLSFGFGLVVFSITSLFCWFGGYSVGETHDPIPNSNVKPYSANGTTSYGVGE